MKFTALYNSRPTSRNGLADGGFDRVLGEAVPAQLPRRFRRAPSRSARARGAHRLGLERAEGLLDRLCVEAALLQVEADRLVPPATACEGLSADDGQASVVDVADPLEGVERLVPLGRVDPCLRQPFVELVPRAVVAAKRTRCELDRIPVRQVPWRPCAQRPRAQRPLARAPRSPRRLLRAAGGGLRSPAPAAPGPGSPAGSPARRRGAP